MSATISTVLQGVENHVGTWVSYQPLIKAESGKSSVVHLVSASPQTLLRGLAGEIARNQVDMGADIRAATWQNFSQLLD